MSDDKLNKLRDELVKNIEKYEGTKKFDYYNEAVARLNGFDAGAKAQAAASTDEAKPSADAFDEAAAQIELCKWSFASTMSAFKQGARWQHQQLSAQLDKLEGIKQSLALSVDIIAGKNEEIGKLRVENEELKKYSGDVSHYQLITSILTGDVNNLKTQLSAAQTEVVKWKDEYFNVSKFATDYENKLTAANEIILELEKALEYQLADKIFPHPEARNALAKLKEWRNK